MPGTRSEQVLTIAASWHDRGAGLLLWQQEVTAEMAADRCRLPFAELMLTYCGDWSSDCEQEKNPGFRSLPGLFASDSERIGIPNCVRNRPGLVLKWGQMAPLRMDRVEGDEGQRAVNDDRHPRGQGRGDVVRVAQRLAT